MGQQSIQIEEDDDAKFTDGLEEFPFFDASNSFNNGNNHDSISKQPPDSESLPSSPAVRRLFPRKEVRFKNTYDTLPDFDQTYKFSRNLKKDKLNRTRARKCDNSLDSSVITTITSDEIISNDQSVTVDSVNSHSSFLFTLATLIIKAIAFQTTLLVSFVTFPVWLVYSSYMFLIDPLAIIRRVKRHIMRKVSRFLRFCLGNAKWIVYQWVKRNKSTWKLCLQIGWGLLWSAFVGFVLVGLLVLAFVISGAIMKFVMEEPVLKMEELNFDYTRGTPMAFVPIMSCPEPFCLECSENNQIGNVGQSRRVIPLYHKLQATVFLTLPESDYNRNLGIFQVRVDFLSRSGKSLSSTTQPCMLQFKSLPIRFLLTVFKLAPLITGYSSESQTLNIKFKGYTEREIPTSCLRVVLEPRAEFAKGGGVPEIYKAYLKLESQLPFLKRILWSWKATVFVWTSIVMFTVGLFFMLLCCTPVIVSWLQPRGVPSNNNNNNGSR